MVDALSICVGSSGELYGGLIEQTKANEMPIIIRDAYLTRYELRSFILFLTYIKISLILNIVL